MGDVRILTIEEILPYREQAEKAWYENCSDYYRNLVRSHEELRARLENAEAALREAQESRFALIVQNEELGADLAATRARLERVDAALREYVRAAEQLIYAQRDECDYDHEHEEYGAALKAARAALDAAGERSEG